MSPDRVQTGDIYWPGAPNWRAWAHVTKLDPDRPLSQTAAKAVLASGTDAVLIGGSTGITQTSVLDLMSRLRDCANGGKLPPIALEVSTLEAAMPGPDLFLIPQVLNTDQIEWLGRAQVEALTRLLPHFESVIPWHLIIPEAYLILNPDSSVARLTGANTELSAASVAALVAYATRINCLPLLYIEYSGTYGDPEIVKVAKSNAGAAHVVYGGGITNAQQAAEMAAIADTIVVGNLVYSNPEWLAETVTATRSAKF